MNTEENPENLHGKAGRVKKILCLNGENTKETLISKFQKNVRTDVFLPLVFPLNYST